MRHARHAALVVAAAALLAACGPAAEDSPPAGDDPGAPEAGADADPEDADPGDDAEEGGEAIGLDEAARMAVEDAADERGLTEEEIEVVRLEEVDWPDGAMGCPEEGEVYTQAIVPGYVIVLEVGDEEVHYHGAEGQPPFHCEDPADDAELDGGGEA
jgi:hypothetical protein